MNPWRQIVEPSMKSSPRNRVPRLFRDFALAFGPLAALIPLIFFYLFNFLKLGLVLAVLYLAVWAKERKERDEMRHYPDFYQEKLFDQILKENFAEDCCGL